MEPNKTHITPENSAGWLASCGFIFPTNETELSRFNSLFGKIDQSISGEEVDPFRIMRETARNEQDKRSVYPLDASSKKYRMVARRLNALPPHIVQRLRKDRPL
jgi:hypothetical protein